VEDNLFEIPETDAEFFHDLQHGLFNPANGYPKERGPLHAKRMLVIAQSV
jgi:hypothetical protein